MTLYILAGAVLLAAAATLIACRILVTVGVVRTDLKNYNYDPATDPDALEVFGDSPYRLCAKEGNVWWNSQPLERMEITSFDGLRLVGHLLPAEAPTDRLAVVVHGHRCVSGEMGFLARMYHEMGWHVFAADHRAAGASEGRYIGMGYLEQKDMLQWLDVLLKKLGPDTKVLLHGISMGAATVMMMSGAETLPENVRCAVEDCGYTDAFGSFLHHMVRDMPRLPFKKYLICMSGLLYSRRIGYRFSQASPLEAVKHSRLPMLFIHGTHDDVVPFNMMRDLYDAHGGDKRMLVIEVGRHGSCYFDNTPLYEKRVQGFAADYMN